MVSFDLSQTYSRIRLSGSMRADFLNRMSTGDLLKMQPGEGRATVLTTPIGRMVDYLLVLAQEDSLLLLGQGGACEKTLRWLRKHIFFNDDVQVSDETNATHMLFGDVALVRQIVSDVSMESLAPLHHLGHDDALVVRAPTQLGENYFVVGGSRRSATAAGTTQTMGIPQDWESFRVACGYPAFPNEIGEDYNPLEAGLWGAVSFNKGCYTGQEIIARMESRGQIAKKLCLLSEGVGADAVQVGMELFAEAGESAGKVTSATSGMALGYIRSAYAKEGTTLKTAQNSPVQVAKIVRI